MYAQPGYGDVDRTMPKITPNFTREEVACKCGCGADDIDLKFMLKVQKLRDDYGKPMKVNSGVRCAEHNKSVGGAENSYHRRVENRAPMALDIKIENSIDRFRFCRLALAYFRGVGVYKDFVHIDGRSGASVCWTQS